MRLTFLLFNLFLIVCLFIQRMQNAHLFAECAYCRMLICLQNAHLFAECTYCRMHMSLMDTFFIYFLFRRELFVFVSFVWIR